VANTIPDKSLVNQVYQHDLTNLANLAGLSAELKAKQHAEPEFGANWALAAQWTEASRYETADEIITNAFIEAIMNDESGVLPWIKTHW
jgi:hypothetical protein